MRATTNTVIRDVTLRDGLQLTGGLLSPARKIDIVRNLIALGVEEIEVGSLARADLVPPLANSIEVVSGLSETELDRCWIWVATPNHTRRALDAGVRGLQFCLSVSEGHNRANVGRSVQQSMDDLATSLELAAAEGARVQLTLATSFTCPFDGPVSIDAVLALVADTRADGVADVVIADTLGQAIPSEVFTLIEQAAIARPDARLVFHGHDTWGLGVANSLAAIEAGATMVDGALGGLGGCPFAAGASGNTSTEDLAFALRPEWLTSERFAGLVCLGDEIVGELGEPSRSQSATAARRTAPTFSWAVA